MCLKIKLNLVQLLYIPIFALIAVIFLSNWLRDLIILEWDITPFIASILGIVILAFIVVMICLVIYCIARLYWVMTEVIRLAISGDDKALTELINELNKLKSRD